MARKNNDALHPKHPYYDLTTTHYIVRIGGKFKVDYPLLTGYDPSSPQDALVCFIIFCKEFANERRDREDRGDQSLDDLEIQLIERRAGTFRPTGRMRFYQTRLGMYRPYMGTLEVKMMGRRFEGVQPVFMDQV